MHHNSPKGGAEGPSTSGRILVEIGHRISFQLPVFFDKNVESARQPEPTIVVYMAQRLRAKLVVATIAHTLLSRIVSFHVANGGDVLEIAQNGLWVPGRLDSQDTALRENISHHRAFERHE